MRVRAKPDNVVIPKIMASVIVGWLIWVSSTLVQVQKDIAALKSKVFNIAEIPRQRPQAIFADPGFQIPLKEK